MTPQNLYDKVILLLTNKGDTMDDGIKKVHELAEELSEARELKKEYEDRLKDLGNKIKNIEEKKLAGLLDELGISKVSLDDMDISKTLIFRGGYTKHEDPDAFRFLFDSNNDGALKKQIIVNLEDYPGLPIDLDVKGVKYKIEYSIHHATLSSIIKELVEAGKFTTDDIDRYSVYVQPQVKIKKK